MLPGEEIKRILYSVIEDIGKEKIQADITSSIESSQKYIDVIMSKSITNISSESNEGCDAAIEILSEALLHFMLTICTLPSERKIQVTKDLVLDLIIPGLESLRTKPDKSIIIQIIKEKEVDLNKIQQLEFLQPNKENLWLISAKPLSTTTKHRKYSVFLMADYITIQIS